MQYLRKNLILSGWVCMLIGTAFVFVDGTGFLLVTGGILAISGVSLLLLGINTPQEGMTPSEVADWKPPASELPEAGRIMYRIDTTIDEPITTSILCGSCGGLTNVEGTRPPSFVCPTCDVGLWDEEE